MGSPRTVLDGILRYLEIDRNETLLDEAEALLALNDEFHQAMSAYTNSESFQHLPPASTSFDLNALGAWFAEMCAEFDYSVPGRLRLNDL